MSKMDPYHIVKGMHVTEKAMVLQNLKNAESNPSISKCNAPKYVFVVDKKAAKGEIAQAIEQIYGKQGIRVVSVNTITLKPKKKRMRGRIGFRSGIKKAIVTLEAGDSLDDS